MFLGCQLFLDFQLHQQFLQSRLDHLYHLCLGYQQCLDCPPFLGYQQCQQFLQCLLGQLLQLRQHYQLPHLPNQKTHAQLQRLTGCRVLLDFRYYLRVPQFQDFQLIQLFR